MKIALTPVESSQIAGIGHDPATSTLAVQFKKKAGPGSIYYYSNVPAQVFADFIGAESKGKYFGANIKSNADYPYQKIEPEAKDEAQGEAA